VAIGHAPNEGLLKCDILYICAAVDKISTGTVSHGYSVIAVPFVKFWNPHPMFGTGEAKHSIFDTQIDQYSWQVYTIVFQPGCG